MSQVIRDEFARVRAQTEVLSAPLSAEDCQIQSMPDASPAKWHLAHTTWFFETFVLEKFEPGFVPFDASFRVLFNSYYQGVGAQPPRAQRGLISRPGLAQVLAYRQQVNQRVRGLLESFALVPPALAELLTLGLQHEQQHQELLLTDIQHALSLNPCQPAYQAPLTQLQTHLQPLRWHSYAGGLIEHGYSPDLDGAFAFDNETPRHKVYLAPFELAHRPLSNAECMAFIQDGGYQRPELWLSLGWDWVQAGQRRLPLYWQGDGADGYQHFSLQGLRAVNPAAPACHLSYFEADALARWSGARLPTEFEWELAARSAPPAHQPDGQGANFAERALFQPLPAPLAQQAGLTPVQLWGDVWEWTQSPYHPYPGYRPWGGVVGEYNGKFMCQQLVLRGGSCATPQSHMRASYRNFFPPDAQWQFSGVRLARDGLA